MTENAKTPKTYLIKELTLPGERLLDTMSAFKTIDAAGQDDLVQWARDEMVAIGHPIKESA